VQRALHEVYDTYRLANVCADYPEMLIGAKKGSPLILGVGQNEYVLASGVSAIVQHTEQALYLSDNEMVTVDPKSFPYQDDRQQSAQTVK
jgi:glutamine---fructose-6-phosphate transaminase (isomerizing)